MGSEMCIRDRQCIELLEKMGDAIEKVDVYYNPHTTLLKGITEMVNVYDIRTQKEV